MDSQETYNYVALFLVEKGRLYVKNLDSHPVELDFQQGLLMFHDIELNVDAVNRDFHLPLVLTSVTVKQFRVFITPDEIRVVITNLDCVGRLKTKDDQPLKSATSGVSGMPNEPSPDTAYKLIIRDILTNLLVHCKGIALKIIEEDVTLYIYMDTLLYQNVDDDWAKTRTNTINVDKVVTRKLMGLVGLYVELTKTDYLAGLTENQYSETNETETCRPILPNAYVQIRLLHGFNYLLSEEPLYTHVDITLAYTFMNITQNDIPMLFKLANKFLYEDMHADMEESTNSDVKEAIAKEHNPSPQGNETSQQCKTEKLIPVFHIGLYVDCLDLNLYKLQNEGSKETTKVKLTHLLTSQLCTFICKMTRKKEQWLNLQGGIQKIIIKIPTENSTHKKEIFHGGSDVDMQHYFYYNETLYDRQFSFAHLKNIYLKEGNATTHVIDWIHSLEFNVNDHLNYITESFLLRRTPAYSFDYVKGYDSIKRIQRADMRFILGSCVMKVTADVLDICISLYKALSLCCSSPQHYNSGALILEVVPSEQNDQVPYIKCKTSRSFTFCDIGLEFYLKSSKSLTCEPFLSGTNPFLTLLCVGVNAEIEDYDERLKVSSIKAEELVCSILRLDQDFDMLRCEKLDWRTPADICNAVLDLRLEPM